MQFFFCVWFPELQTQWESLFQVMFLRWYLFSNAKLKPVNCCFQAPGKKKSPWRVVWDAHPSCWSAAAAGKVQDSILCLHPSPQHWLLYFFIYIEDQHWVNWMSCSFPGDVPSKVTIWPLNIERCVCLENIKNLETWNCFTNLHVWQATLFFHLEHAFSPREKCTH